MWRLPRNDPMLRLNLKISIVKNLMIGIHLIYSMVRNWFCSVFNVVCVVNVCPVHAVDLN